MHEKMFCFHRSLGPFHGDCDARMSEKRGDTQAEFLANHDSAHHYDNAGTRTRS